ncbi:uncharacterized protein M6B38_412395 [Iris pallida]|uniref:Uncharacterized protein n=1 Tax=Iris pallida TaxID=29817 RepID=A0AAX6FLZ1_IRIPA|nr:uncharacterized protein M6B38_412395 [Iris pallida]
MSFKADFGEEHSEHGSNRVLRDTISALTGHLASLGKPGTEAGVDRGATSYITLAGGNKGAVMKAADSLQEMLQKAAGDERVSAWTNSNYQSVNNSIMIDGECHAEDPGVHIEIMDFLEDVDEDDDHHEIKKGKKKPDMKKDRKEEKGKEDADDDDDEDEDRDDEKEGRKVKDKKKEKTKETDEDEERDNEKEGKKVKDKKKEKKEKK